LIDVGQRGRPQRPDLGFGGGALADPLGVGGRGEIAGLTGVEDNQSAQR